MPNRFSIIMLVYNTKEEYLRYAIDSVLNQSFSDYEFIIIDDGSNEVTKKILEDYKDKCIIKHQENMGMPGSRIEGLKIASGDYVIFVDSDDYINPDTLKIYDGIISECNVDVVLHDFVKFTGNIDSIIANPHYFSEGIQTKDEVLRQLCLMHTNGTCGRAVRRSLFEGMEQHIDRSFQVGEDVQQSAYVLLRANSFYYTDKKIYLYRIVYEHREYYGIERINDCNFMTPVFKMIFKDDSLNNLLPIFKASAQNSVVYNAFRICLFAENKDQKYSLLKQLAELEINDIIKSIKPKSSFVSETLYYLFAKKHYWQINILSRIYDKIYGMQRL